VRLPAVLAVDITDWVEELMKADELPLALLLLLLPLLLLAAKLDVTVLGTSEDGALTEHNITRKHIHCYEIQYDRSSEHDNHRLSRNICLGPFRPNSIK